MTKIELHNGDCLEIMPQLIKDNIKVDAIIADIPYGTTACKWDNVIPFEPMWDRINKLIKDNGAVVLFGSEPFSSKLRMSNLKMYRYDWIWNKDKGSDPLNANKRPLNDIENVMVFYKKNPVYNPQMKIGTPYTRKQKNSRFNDVLEDRDIVPTDKINLSGLRFPTRIIYFARDVQKTTHPTQKPVALIEYLVKTYTNEGDTVLDFTMGSGTTGVACKKLNRKFIGIELDENYFKLAKERIENTICRKVLIDV